MKVEIGTEAAQFPGKGIHEWDFRCSVYTGDTKAFVGVLLKQDSRWVLRRSQQTVFILVTKNKKV
jgi:hypothetical protein